MKENDSTNQHRRTSGLTRWSLFITILVVGLVITSWVIISQMAQKRLPPTTGTAPQKTSQDLYIGYKDVMYRLSGHNGSVIWSHPLLQLSKPNRIIGSTIQVHIMSNTLIGVVLEHTFYVLRSSDGKELWHYAVILTPAQQTESRVSIMDVYFDTKLAYVYLASGEIVALDIQNGSQKWKEVKFPNGASLFANNGTLYAKASSSNGEPVLYAFDGATGQERWHFQREMWGNSSFSPPLIINGVFYSAGNPLYALDARTGKKLWEQRLPDRSRYFDDIRLQDGMLYAGTQAAMTLVGGQKVPPEIWQVFAFNPATGNPLWHSQAGYQMVGDVSINHGVLVTKSVLPESNGQQILQALDAKKGTKLWQTTLENLPCDVYEFCSQQIQVAGQKLYILDYSQLQIFDLLSGKQLAHYPVALPLKKSIGQSVLNNGMLYIQSAIHEGGDYVSGSSNTFWRYTLNAIRLTDGSTAWQYKIGALREYQDPISELYLAPL